MLTRKNEKLEYLGFDIIVRYSKYSNQSICGDISCALCPSLKNKSTCMLNNRYFIRFYETDYTKIL